MANDMTLSIYDITAEERRFIEALIEGEGELTEELQTAMDLMEEKKVCKVQSYHNLYVHLQAVADAARQEEDRLARKRKTAEAGMRRLKDGLLYNMEALGLTRLEGETVEARLRANPPRVEFDEGEVLKPYMAEIDRLAALLPDYITIAPVVSRSGLKAALEAGEPVDSSVHVERSNTVIFR